MKSTTDVIQLIYAYLISQGVKATVGLTGGIYWLRRPKSSIKEDIVISAVAMNAEQVQEGVFNINIHVPNLPLATDDTQPNFARLDAIAAVLVPLLREVRINDWFFYIDEPATPVPDGNGWFCNIRIKFYTLRNVA